MKYLSYEGLQYLYAKIKARIDQKVDKADGKGLSTNDYTDQEKKKLAELGRTVNRRTVNLPAAGWSASFPYTQTVTASGVAAADDVKIIGVFVPAAATQDQVKALIMAAGYLIYNPDGTAAGKITFKAYKKPAVDMQIITEGA